MESSCIPYTVYASICVSMHVWTSNDKILVEIRDGSTWTHTGPQLAAWISDFARYSKREGETETSVLEGRSNMTSLLYLLTSQTHYKSVTHAQTHTHTHSHNMLTACFSHLKTSCTEESFTITHANKHTHTHIWLTTISSVSKHELMFDSFTDTLTQTQRRAHAHSIHCESTHCCLQTWPCCIYALAHARQHAFTHMHPA